MPELPDIEVYLGALQRHLGGRTIEEVQLKSPFLVRSVEPPLASIAGKEVESFRRIGKRIVWKLADGPFLVFHLMIAGRFHWKRERREPKARNDLLALHFEHGTMMLTEAGTQKRASLHVVAEEADLSRHDPGGLEVFECDLEQFAERLRSENHTLKRSLTDPKLFSGIGNAFSDEILHAAGLSPVQLSSNISDDDIAGLFEATRATLARFTELYTSKLGQKFPEKVTAFTPEMAVHGKFKQPCPVCETAVQRIAYANRETNYSGEVFLSHTELEGSYTLRLSIGSVHTRARDVELALRSLEEAVDAELEEFGRSG